MRNIFPRTKYFLLTLVSAFAIYPFAATAQDAIQWQAQAANEVATQQPPDDCFVGKNVFYLMGDRSALAYARPSTPCDVGPNVFKLMGDHSALANATPASPCDVGPNVFKLMGDHSALANATPASPCYVGPNILRPTGASRGAHRGRGIIARAAPKRALSTHQRLVQAERDRTRY